MLNIVGTRYSKYEMNIASLEYHCLVGIQIVSEDSHSILEFDIFDHQKADFYFPKLVQCQTNGNGKGNYIRWHGDKCKLASTNLD